MKTSSATIKESLLKMAEVRRGFGLAVLLVFSACAFETQAQSYNPYLVQGSVTPAPMLPVEFGGTGTLSFDVGNTGSSVISKVTGQEMLITVSLSGGVPNGSPLAAVSGPGSTLFTWQYNESTKTYQGKQAAAIPAGYRGTIAIGYQVTVNNFLGNAQNGFNANISPPAFTNPQPTDDDTVSAYTYVSASDFGDAPASYGTVSHKIDLSKETAGTYSRYYFLGNGVDPESAMQHCPYAKGDDLARTSPAQIADENGVVFPKLIAGGASVSIPVTVTLVDTPVYTPRLSGWIDWNGDGVFVAAERIATNISVSSSGTLPILVTVPADAITTRPTYARFRFGAAVTSPSGTTAATSGEVEDYLVVIQPSENATQVIFDAQGGSSPTPFSKSVTLGAAYGTLATTANTPFVFGGWWTAPGGTGAQVTSATVVGSSTPHTLFAFWTVPPAQPTLELSLSGKTHISAKVGSGSFDVTSNASWTATVQGGASWVTITSGGACTGNGTVVYSLTANNTTATRIAVIRVSTGSQYLDFTITQAGTPSVRISEVCELSNGHRRIRWNGDTTRTYRLERSTRLSFSPETTVTWSGIPGAGATTEFVDASVASKTFFYRIALE